MMDQIASLMQRGLISPDAAQGFVQKIANVPKPGVPNPPLEGGGAGTRIGETVSREPLLGNAETGISIGAPKKTKKQRDKEENLRQAMQYARDRMTYLGAPKVEELPNHLENLRSSGTDQAKFRSAMDQLSADKSLKNDDLKQIVKDYDAGGVVMGKTREDHLRQIEQAFVRNARFENKLK